jgi:methionyl-tRNA formyltransferase
MKKREIVKDPNPILRAEAEQVSSFDGAIQELIDDMILTMRESDGIGLAAPQVGESKKILVAEYETKDESEDSFPLCVLINPEIISESKEEKFMVEGCLSFPGKELYVKRPKEIEVKAQDRWGKSISMKCSNLFGRVIQHENDHLNGILMIDHVKPVKTVFVGNGSLGIPVLNRMINDPQFELTAVFTSLDKIAGRKNELKETPIATESSNLKLKIIKIGDINDGKSINLIKEINPELIVLTDFGQILSKKIIELPKYGILNIHPSMLPKYRGTSPVVSALLAGEKRTGVSIIKLNDKIDSGNILSQIEIKIRPRETAESLKETLAEVGADLLAETVPYYLSGEITPVVQKDENVIQTKRIEKSDGELKGDEDSKKVDLMVRALSPWPGVYKIVNGKKIFITKAHLDKTKSLVIDKVKPEGKREMTYKEFALGNSERLTFSS